MHGIVATFNDSDGFLKTLAIADITALSWNIPAEKLRLLHKKIYSNLSEAMSEEEKFKSFHVSVDQVYNDIRLAIMKEKDEYLALLKLKMERPSSGPLSDFLIQR